MRSAFKAKLSLAGMTTSNSASLSAAEFVVVSSENWAAEDPPLMSLEGL